MYLKKSSITADILYCLSDGQLHTMQEIADEIEVSSRTVRSHIQSLSYRYPIETIRGGTRGGVILDKKYLYQGKMLSNDELQLISKALKLLQESECEGVDQKLLSSLIEEYKLPTSRENEHEREM